MGFTLSQLFCVEIPPLGLREMLASALVLAGGAKPASLYLERHKIKCSVAFNTSLGLELDFFPVLPPASAVNFY